jgi:hypothetical protein
MTGSVANARIIVTARITVGDYTTELEAETQPTILGIGQANECAIALAKALEKWVIENADAIKAQMAKVVV